MMMWEGEKYIVWGCSGEPLTHSSDGGNKPWGGGGGGRSWVMGNTIPTFYLVMCLQYVCVHVCLYGAML